MRGQRYSINKIGEQAVADQRAAAPQLKVLVNVQPLTMNRSGAPSSMCHHFDVQLRK